MQLSMTLLETAGLVGVRCAGTQQSNDAPSDTPSKKHLKSETKPELEGENCGSSSHDKHLLKKKNVLDI